MFLRNVGICLEADAALQSRRHRHIHLDENLKSHKQFHFSNKSSNYDKVLVFSHIEASICKVNIKTSQHSKIFTFIKLTFLQVQCIYDSLKLHIMWVLIHTTNSTGLSTSWEANSGSAGQEIPHFSCISKVHYRVHKSLPLGPILCQMSPVHTLIPCLFKIHFNIILPPTTRSPNKSLSFWFSDLKFYMICLSLPCVIHVQPVPSFMIWSP
jgi:hypothetical protein